MVIIKEIIIDGFKSYGSKTVFSNLDPKFNSITGTNGSGKSNFLDSICFVLGLSNLSVIRASKLQDLIFQNEKIQNKFALVCITLSDKNLSKKFFNFENLEKISFTRKILASGKNKYFLNGKNISPNKVLNFLYSINININNPHFFVRQGHIMRIVRMNSWELLQTVETAFGIKLYSIKKKNAIDLIKKKNQKVKEIGNLLINQIRPQLNKIGKSDFIFQKMKFFKKKNKKWTFLFSFIQKQKKKFILFSEEKEKKINVKFNVFLEIKKKIFDRIIKKIYQNKKKIDKNLKFLKLFSKKNKIKKISRFENQKMVNKFLIQKKFFNFLEKIKVFYNLKKKKNEKRKIFNFLFLKKKKKKKNFIKERFLKILKNSKFIFLINHFLSQLELYLIVFMIEREKFFQNLNFFKKNFLKENLFFSFKYREGERENFFSFFFKQKILMVQSEILRKINQKLFKNIEPFFFKGEKSLWKIRFSIYGIIGSMLHIKKSFFSTVFEFSNPIQTKFVVTINEVYSRIILEEIYLLKKISIIPLSKIIFSEKTNNNDDFFPPIIKYLSFKKKISKSIIFIFRNLKLIFDSQNAKNIAFSSQKKIRCISLTGDIFESPASVIAGKNEEEGFCFLCIFSEFSNQKTWFSRRGAIQKKNFSRGKIFYKNNTYLNHYLIKKKTGFIGKKQILFFHFFFNSIKKYENYKKNLKKRIQFFEKFLYSYFLNKIKKKTKVSFMDIKKESFKKKKLNFFHTFEYLNNTIEKFFKKFIHLFNYIFLCISFLKFFFSFSKNFLFLTKLKFFLLFKYNKKIQQSVRKILFMNQINFLEIFNDFYQKKDRIEFNTEKKLATNSKIFLEKSNFFIIQNNIEFFDIFFKKKLKIFFELNNKNRTKFVNPGKIFFLIESSKQYRELISKRVMIEKDKFIIQHIIHKLDLKKNKIIFQAMKKINFSLQVIFSILIPGSIAKLVLIRTSQKALLGIDFRITSGQNRFQTIEELSGGQKSILALSFIFALLLTKPAPFYILDEIDAALDLCHTQNIGKLINIYFPMSQFLIVSLKNGIINNAKVIFKVKNLLGKSFISRIEK